MYCDCTRDGVVHHNSTNAHTLQWEFQVSSQQYLLHSTSMYSCVGFVSKTLIQHGHGVFRNRFQGKQRPRAYLWLNILIVVRRTVRRDRGSASTMHFAPVLQFLWNFVPVSCHSGQQIFILCEVGATWGPRNIGVLKSQTAIVLRRSYDYLNIFFGI